MNVTRVPGEMVIDFGVTVLFAIVNVVAGLPTLVVVVLVDGPPGDPPPHAAAMTAIAKHAAATAATRTRLFMNPILSNE